MHTRIPYGASQKARILHSWMIGQYRELKRNPDVKAIQLYRFLEKDFKKNSDRLNDSELKWILSENTNLYNQFR